MQFNARTASTCQSKPDRFLWRIPSDRWSDKAKGIILRDATSESGSDWWILIIDLRSSLSVCKVSGQCAQQEINAIRETIADEPSPCFASYSAWSLFPFMSVGNPHRVAPEVGRSESLGPRGRSAVAGLPDIAHQRRAMPFPRSIRRPLYRRRWHAQVARPTSRTGSTIRVGAPRLDFRDARQSTTLLVLLMP